MTPIVECGEHGRSPIEYLMCSRCRRVYAINMINHDEFVVREELDDGRCACGARFVEDSARLICTPCAKRILEEMREGAS